MGQYYKPVCIEAGEYLYSHNYNSGLKLMEHSWLPNGFVNTVMKLISPTGRWYGKRIVWAGDYGDRGLFLEGAVHKYDEDGNEMNLYSYASNHFEEINPPQEELDETLRYIVNHNKKEFVDLTRLQENDGWTVHPLPLLTSNGNGRGGGDYGNMHGDNGIEYVGTWAGDVVTAEYMIRKDEYTEIMPDFFEE